ncbi:putative hemoglobin and hemoglobin-haptoglobin-binding protein 2 [Mizugakiibacter sediminis]|uniref:Putative hemoglobin and hemoglobin-haptoglobin-binding protein 2 n=1 Tax=Mizugakiibacter sediminis TaxID=1475481 RepID=A0A0K8QM47_9GAMM|nr:TonB-dependent receptor [Mizugakiibacter sediminis]GAP65781.1 putative hemoglobin and hemoglobin-haptoglobin-binding protein 2 [Mizugakiibacter sediminis]
MSNPLIQRSIRHALASRGLGKLPLLVPALAAAAPFAAAAQDAVQPAAKPQSLETIVVTGSRIRRVDLETASPVFSIDRAQIQQSGKVTLGDLVQQIPAISGNANNPQVNNGGGDGASRVSLRGLGDQRTLVLVNGQRVVDGDVNAIPAAMVERVEVLKDGASAVYGSDAIAGVVNFILRSNYQGAEFAANYGVSARGDGARKGYTLAFGQSGDQGSVIGGVGYDHFDAVSASSRDFSKATYNLRHGQKVTSGSFASVSGLIFAPQFANCPNQFGAGTYDPSAPGGNGIPAGYRCYVDPSASGPGDTYNYQATNLILTPQERTHAFMQAKYRLNDDIEAFLDVFHNRTTSESQLAPEPLDFAGEGITLSAGNPNNPFGVPIGGDGSVGDLAIRMFALGNRQLHYTTTSDQAVAGLKGGVGDTSWQWEADLNYGHYSQLGQSYGYLDTAGLVADGSLGDNCVQGSSAKGGCLNIFNQKDPATAALLKLYAANPFYNTLYTMRQAEVSANGELFELPAGAVSLAAGGTYRKEYQHYMVDYIAVADPETGNCKIQSEACSTPNQGGFSVKEAYAELFLPVLKDLPFAKVVNVTIGSRYSDYNLAGNTTNSKLAVEWRPIDDLLLRGTVAAVFRAPNINELYAGAATSFDTYTTPCGPNDAVDPVHGRACVGGGLSRSGDQIQTLISGAIPAGGTLRPEKGKSFDWGFVYDPHWLEGFSANVDLWRIYLTDLIVRPTAQTVVDMCYTNPNSAYCDNITWLGNGAINIVKAPYTNLGRLDTRGVDMGFKYRLPETRYGNFALSLDSTYIAQYDNDQTPGLPGDVVSHVAAHYNSQYGNYARWRALAGVNWNLGAWSAAWNLRYIGPLSVGSADLSQGYSADQKVPGVVLRFGAQVYNNFSVGYDLKAFNSRIDMGVDNAFDKQPPLMYQNNVENANTDVNTYDTLGRYWWGRVTVKF